MDLDVGLHADGFPVRLGQLRDRRVRCQQLRVLDQQGYRLSVVAQPNFALAVPRQAHFIQQGVGAVRIVIGPGGVHALLVVVAGGYRRNLRGPAESQKHRLVDLVAVDGERQCAAKTHVLHELPHRFIARGEVEHDHAGHVLPRRQQHGAVAACVFVLLVEREALQCRLVHLEVGVALDDRQVHHLPIRYERTVHGIDIGKLVSGDVDHVVVRVALQDVLARARLGHRHPRGEDRQVEGPFEAAADELTAPPARVDAEIEPAPVARALEAGLLHDRQQLVHRPVVLVELLQKVARAYRVLPRARAPVAVDPPGVRLGPPQAHRGVVDDVDLNRRTAPVRCPARVGVDVGVQEVVLEAVANVLTGNRHPVGPLYAWTDVEGQRPTAIGVLPRLEHPRPQLAVEGQGHIGTRRRQPLRPALTVDVTQVGVAADRPVRVLQRAAVLPYLFPGHQHQRVVRQSLLDRRQVTGGDHRLQHRRLRELQSPAGQRDEVIVVVLLAKRKLIDRNAAGGALGRGVAVFLSRGAGGERHQRGQADYEHRVAHHLPPLPDRALEARDQAIQAGWRGLCAVSRMSSGSRAP